MTTVDVDKPKDSEVSNTSTLVWHLLDNVEPTR
jgi:hypothetical protein